MELRLATVPLSCLPQSRLEVLKNGCSALIVEGLIRVHTHEQVRATGSRYFQHILLSCVQEVPSTIDIHEFLVGSFNKIRRVHE